MPDIPSLTAAFVGLKTAMDIAKGFRESDLTYDKAEGKLKLSELMNALADAKMSIAETIEILEKKDTEIKSLREALETKRHLTHVKQSYYELDENGNATGDPYCSRCWEVDFKQVHMVQDYYKKMWVCPNCKNIVRQQIS